MALATIPTTVTGLQGRPVATATPTANQILGWNGSAWAPLPPVLPLTGGTLTGNLVSSGAIITTGGSIQGPGNSGSFLNGSGIDIMTGKAFAQFNTLTTGYNQFTSTSPTMGGMGTQLKLTPQVTGRVLCYMRPFAYNTVAGSAFDMQLSYGTGTPPAAGAASTGQSLGINLQMTSNLSKSYDFTQVATGLTVGTQYWFDTLGWVSAGSVGVYAYMTVGLLEF